MENCSPISAKHQKQYFGGVEKSLARFQRRNAHSAFAGQHKHNNNNRLAPLPPKTDEEAPLAMREWGLVVQRGVLDAAGIAELRLHVTNTIAAVKFQLALHRPQIQVGVDLFCFREIAVRGEGRFNLRLQHNVPINEFIQIRIVGHPRVAALLQESLGSSPNESSIPGPALPCRPGMQMAQSINNPEC